MNYIYLLSDDQVPFFPDRSVDRGLVVARNNQQTQVETEYEKSKQIPPLPAPNAWSIKHRKKGRAGHNHPEIVRSHFLCPSITSKVPEYSTFEKHREADYWNP
jgi:hypothetical protein